MDSLVGKTITSTISSGLEIEFTFRDPPDALFDAIEFALIMRLPIELDGLLVRVQSMDVVHEDPPSIYTFPPNNAMSVRLVRSVRVDTVGA